MKKGGSIKLLREYFHQQCNIIGVDVDKGCPQFPNDAHIKVVLASSLDPTAMRKAFKVAFMVHSVHCICPQASVLVLKISVIRSCFCLPRLLCLTTAPGAGGANRRHYRRRFAQNGFREGNIQKSLAIAVTHRRLLA